MKMTTRIAGDSPVKLDCPCTVRYEITTPTGRPKKQARAKDGMHMYGAPRNSALAYIWPERNDRYVVAVAPETRVWRHGKNVGCFHVFDTMDAATMFAYAMIGGA